MAHLCTTKERWLISIILFSMITTVTIAKSDKIFYPSPDILVMLHWCCYIERNKIFIIDDNVDWLSYNIPNEDKEFSVKIPLRNHWNNNDSTLTLTYLTYALRIPSLTYNNTSCTTRWDYKFVLLYLMKFISYQEYNNRFRKNSLIYMFLCFIK